MTAKRARARRRKCHMDRSPSWSRARDFLNPAWRKPHRGFDSHLVRHRVVQELPRLSRATRKSSEKK